MESFANLTDEMLVKLYAGGNNSAFDIARHVKSCTAGKFHIALIIISAICQDDSDTVLHTGYNY